MDTQDIPKVQFEVWQDGFPVTCSDSDNEADALREARHYAMVYGQDGPVVIVKLTREMLP